PHPQLFDIRLTSLILPHLLSSLLLCLPPTSALFPYTTLFRSRRGSSSSRVRWSSALFPEAIPACSRLFRPKGACERSRPSAIYRSEEHTSELQSRFDLVCRLLLEKKKI